MTWPQVQLRRLFRVVNGGTPTADPENWGGGIPWATPADLASVDGKVLRSTDRTITTAGLISGSRSIPAGSLLLSTRAPIGYVAEVDRSMAFNQGCRGLVPRSNLIARFYRYVVAARRDDLQSLGSGSTFMELDMNSLGGLRVPFPPHDEQRRIVEYLDGETARIDEVVKRKEQLGEVLRARVAAGVLGDIRHSTVRSVALKRVARVIDCKHRTPTYVESGYPVVSPGDVEPGTLDLSRCHRFVDEVDWADLAGGPRRPRVGDIIYSRNASVGIASLVTKTDPFCMGQDVCIVRTSRPDGDGRFLSYVLNTWGLEQIELTKIGSTFSRINVSQISDLQVPALDPSEQDRLVAKWDALVRRVASTEARLSTQIELLRERRGSLIVEAVSGALEAA